MKRFRKENIENATVKMPIILGHIANRAASLHSGPGQESAAPKYDMDKRNRIINPAIPISVNIRNIPMPRYALLFGLICSVVLIYEMQ